jgi:hypothetical protein
MVQALSDTQSPKRNRLNGQVTWKLRTALLRQGEIGRAQLRKQSLSLPYLIEGSAQQTNAPETALFSSTRPGKRLVVDANRLDAGRCLSSMDVKVEAERMTITRAEPGRIARFVSARSHNRERPGFVYDAYYGTAICPDPEFDTYWNARR